MDTLRDKETLDYLWESRQAQWKRWQGSCRLFEMYKKILEVHGYAAG